ncbi:MAG TPA: sugar kinase [Planctomycetaceae bacterium]|nr:sugar kinase [Planctomycetaceae bacterium]HQZ67010.1 sugar kinase [Planctomycetaceae bacterium]
MMTRIVTFGEIMARMAPTGLLRLRQALPGSLDVTFAGAEANVASSLTLLGCRSDFVTALPNGPLTEACLGNLRNVGVGVDHIRITDRGRFGIYFVEMGANQRPSRVFYDREHSAISQAKAADFNWEVILDGATWLHLTGITPALSMSAAEATIHAAQSARAKGVSVSCDVNFRTKLWHWDPARSPEQLAGGVLRQLLPHVDLLMASEEDFRLVGVTAPVDRGDGKAPGVIGPDRAVKMARLMAEAFPNLRMISTTLRENISASHNNWGAVLLDIASDTDFRAPLQSGLYQPYEIRSIVDRVGSGDAFDAGLLYGLTHPEFSVQSALDFATAASCLSHSVIGDCNFASRKEIEELMNGARSGRVVR